MNCIIEGDGNKWSVRVIWAQKDLLQNVGLHDVIGNLNVS